MSAFGVVVERPRALAAPSTSSGVQWNQYLYAGGQMVGVRYDDNNAPDAIRYFDKDNLGSIATITDEGGTVVERDAYDVWGKRFRRSKRSPGSFRLPPADRSSPQRQRRSDRQHHQPDEPRLHRPGGARRCRARPHEPAPEPVLRPAQRDRWDPLIGRFTSADPVVGQPFSTQGFDRYAYVGNNPLAFTDPSGMCFLGCFWKPIFRSPIFKVVVAVAIAVTAQYELEPVLYAAYGGTAIATVEASATVGFISGAAAAGVTGGNVLEGAVIGGFTAGAFAEVGGATGFHNATWGYATHHLGQFALNIAGHTAVGCVAAAAEGGDCGPQALAAGISAAAAPALGSAFADAQHNNVGQLIEGTVASSVVGGVTAIAGGGKFENGAVTAAFGYLYNELGQKINGIFRMPTSWTPADIKGYAEMYSRLSAPVTYFIGPFGEATAYYGESVAAGYVWDSTGEHGWFFTGGQTEGYAIGYGGLAGVQVGGVSSFRGSGASINAATPYIGGSIMFDKNGNASGDAVTISPLSEYGYSSSVSRTCVSTNRQSGC